MMPPEMIEGMRQSPDWKLMESVAPTLVYDNIVMGDVSVPTQIAATVTVPALVLDGGESTDFKHAAVDALAKPCRKPSEKRSKDKILWYRQKFWHQY